MAFGVELTELILLTMTITTAIVAIGILLDVSSRKHRSRYGRAVKYLFAVGAILGVALPWNEQVGLVASLVVSVLLLFLSFGYYLIGGRVNTFKFLYSAWTPRDRIRDWFLYFSIVTGVIGIVSTVLSVVIPPFLSFAMSPFIPVAFDSVSVLSALMEFTIYVPPHHNILALVYNFVLHSNMSLNRGEPYVEDLDFRALTEGTTFTSFDVRDVMEVLVTRGFASKISPTPLGKVGFSLNEQGMKYLQAVWSETYSLFVREKDGIESEITYLYERLRLSPEIGKDVSKSANQKIEALRRRILQLTDDYGLMAEQSWQDRLNQRLSELELSLSNKAETVERVDSGSLKQNQ
ncbi:MAG: hypothetical protein HYU39_03070 [Thaumarchaeota archaeon]|nr:hypothetical protein [Nitrososphaerota archaeon]